MNHVGVCVWSWVDAGKVIHLCSPLLPSAFGPAALLWRSRMRECCAERFPSRLVSSRSESESVLAQKHDSCVMQLSRRPCLEVVF